MSITLEDRQRLAERAPQPRMMTSSEELCAKLEEILESQFCLSMLPEFTVVVEGTTDRDYLLAAAKKARDRFGEDLLAVTSPAKANAASEIRVCTPGKPGDADRGGVPQMVRLAQALRPFVFTLEMFSGVVFVFDHDDAGMQAQKDLAKVGFRTGQNSITLSAKDHPGACATKQIVIEDLLSLDIQERYFAQGSPWCSAIYEDGKLVRYVWKHQSKALLRDYVCEAAEWRDLREVGRILARIRSIFGMPTDGAIFQAEA